MAKFGKIISPSGHTAAPIVNNCERMQFCFHSNLGFAFLIFANCVILHLQWRRPRLYYDNKWYLSVGPDLAKFLHFGTKNKVSGNFWKFVLEFGQILNLLWPIFLLLVKRSSVKMAKYWKNNLAIWSHWYLMTRVDHVGWSWQAMLMKAII